MSVVSILDFAPPRMGISASGKTITRRLRAVCDDVLDGPLTISVHASCPVYGETYAYYGETDATFGCTDVSIDPRSDNSGTERYVFDVTATYSNAVTSGGTGEDEEDPLDDPPVYEFSFNKYQIPADKDVDGVAVKNGANEQFDPLPLIDENRPLVVVRRHEASFSPAVAVEYQDTVNESAWAGVEAGVAKINSISATSATRGEVAYWVVTYEIELRWSKWNPTKILAQGYMYRRDSIPLPAPEQYLDPKTAQPPSVPILLRSGTGTKLPDGDDPQFEEYNFYREKDFSALNLGL